MSAKSGAAMGSNVVLISVTEPDPVGSGRLGPDPHSDPGLDKLYYLNFFGICKSSEYFLVHEDTFRAYFHQKNFREKVSRKFI
jgi:hypothetical protein